MANSIAGLDLAYMGSQALNVAQEKTIPFDVFTTRYVSGASLESDVVKVYPLTTPTAVADWNDSTNKPPPITNELPSLSRKPPDLLN